MKLSYLPYPLELKHRFGVSGHTRTSTPDVLVCIEHEGVKGYGEASMPPYLGESIESVSSFLGNVNLGQFNDPLLLEDILDYTDSLMPGNCAAKAAIDIALHDLAGKLLGIPCYRLFGLNPHKAPATTYTIGIDEPSVMQQKIKEVEGQFRLLKIKLGTDRDDEIIKAVREVTSLPLAVDANQGWKDVGEASERISMLAENNVVMIEQPMKKDRLDDIAQLRELSPVPLYADESVQRAEDIYRLKGVFDGINIKLMKCTGMREAWKMINIARSMGMKTMLGCMTETSCAVTAAAQLSPAVGFADLDGNLLIGNDPFEGVKVEEGMLRLNNLPGLGLRHNTNLCF